MLTGEENHKLQVSHLRGQAISYFAFALLFMRSYSLNVGSVAPFLSLDTSDRWPVPMPIFRFPDWVPIALACICLGICLYFLSSLIPTRWRAKAVGLSLSWRLTFPFSIMVLASFVVSWLAGISPLTGLSRPWFEILYWAGFGLFIFLSVHSIQTMIQQRKEPKRGEIQLSIAGTLGHWVRSGPRHTYERQFSPGYWNAAARWQRVRFTIGTRLFSVRRWTISQRQYFLIVLEILKTISWGVAFAVVIVVALAAANYRLALPDSDATASRELLGIAAQVAGVFLGLYFTAVSVVASSVYAKVPGEVRELLTKEKVGNLYIRLVALSVAVAMLLLAKGALGFPVGILDVLSTAVLIVIAIFSFVELGMRIFYFFDFTELAAQLDSELYIAS